MKVETRGKYPGVKVHLDPEECEELLTALPELEDKDFDNYKKQFWSIATIGKLGIRMGKHISELLKDQPDLLKERTPEQVAAILAKDHEKTGIQLNRLKNGKDWKKIEPETLKKALMHHVKT